MGHTSKSLSRAHPFLGRDEEMDILEEAYDSPKSQFYPIYGRRRVGKTQLILEFASRHPSIYFLGKEGAEDIQIQEFVKVAAVAFQQPLLEVAAAGITDWRTALSSVMSARPKGKKTILVLDEFQWITASSPILPSLLQELWDQEWKRSGDVFVILCGSYMGFMEREVLGEKSPLFGRRTGQILLQPFDYQEAALFHPSLSTQDHAETYFLCGGIPYYLEFFDPKRSIAQNIQQNFLSKSGPLYREPDFLLREELREVENYYAVLMSIASGSATSTEIAKKTGIPYRSIYYYLQNLIDLRYVRRRFPLTSRKPAARMVRFAINDPLLRFWFRFVYPNGSLITSMGPQQSYEQLIRPELPAYFGLCFEEMCKEALSPVYLDEKMNSPFRVGEFWSKEAQIDLVGLREDRRIDIGECKWGTVRSYKKIVTELLEKISRFPNPENYTIQPRIFLRKKPARAKVPEGFIVHTLEDLYQYQYG